MIDLNAEFGSRPTRQDVERTEVPVKRGGEHLQSSIQDPMSATMFQFIGAIQADAKPSKWNFEQSESFYRLSHSHLTVLAMGSAGERVPAAEGLERTQAAASWSNCFL